MLYATEGVTTDDDLNKAMVGVASVWYVFAAIFVTLLLTTNLLAGMKGTRMYEHLIYV